MISEPDWTAWQAIFDKDPEDGFPLRGDVYLWNMYRAAVRNNMLSRWHDIDALRNELRQMVFELYKLATGKNLAKGDATDGVDFFAKVGYGMSKGCISRAWWRETALPLLEARLENLVGDCTDGACNLLVLETDIVKRTEEAIVCPTNGQMAPTGGVGGALLKAAGPSVSAECRSVYKDEHGDRCPEGECRATRAGDLRCKHLLHTVAPNCQRGATEGAKDSLKSCYFAVLIKADQFGVSSVAFPSIGTGKNSFPVARAAEVAAEAVIRECHVHPDRKIVFCIPDHKTANVYRAAFRRRQAQWN